MSEIPELISTRGAARIIGVNPRTIQRYAGSGILPPAYRLDGKRGAFLFRETELQAFKRQRERDAA